MFQNAKILGLLDKCFDKSEPEYDKLKQDVTKSDDKVLAKLTEDFEAGKMLDNLRRVTAPIIAVHGMKDPIIPLPKDNVWEYLTREKEDFFMPIPLPNVRHFPMLEHDTFPRLMTDFLTVPKITDIEIRERWRRRSR
jgi:pimeloyl-ACP methyl ester carboxylesterase